MRHWWYEDRPKYWGINETLDYQLKISTLLSQKQDPRYSYQDTRTDQKWKKRIKNI